MLRIVPHILKAVLAVAGVVALLPSCSLDYPNARKCDRPVTLSYRYNREKPSGGNVLPQYINSLEEYIFDEGGVLVAVGSPVLNECTVSVR